MRIEFSPEFENIFYLPVTGDEVVQQILCHEMLGITVDPNGSIERNRRLVSRCKLFCGSRHGWCCLLVGNAAVRNEEAGAEWRASKTLVVVSVLLLLFDSVDTTNIPN